MDDIILSKYVANDKILFKSVNAKSKLSNGKGRQFGSYTLYKLFKCIISNRGFWLNLMLNEKIASFSQTQC